MSIVTTLMSAAGEGAARFLAKLTSYNPSPGQCKPNVLVSKKGGYYFADWGLVSGEPNKAVLVRLSHEGVVLWKTKIYEISTTYSTVCVGIAESLDGTKVYVLLDNVEYAAGYPSYLVACYQASDGAFLYKSPLMYSSSSTQPYSLYVDSAGDVYACGSITGYTAYWPKFSGSTLGLISQYGFNATSAQYGAMSRDSSNNNVLAFMSIWDNSGRPGGQAGGLLRFNGQSANSLLTQTTYDSNLPDGHDWYPYSVALDLADNIYMAGNANVSGTYRPFLLKINTNQDVVATKYFTGFSASACTVKSSPAGHIFAFIPWYQGAASAVLIAKFDTNLNLLSAYSVTISGYTPTGITVNSNGSHCMSMAGDMLACTWAWTNSSGAPTSNIPMMLVANIKSNAFLTPGTYSVGGYNITIASVGSLATTTGTFTKYSPTNGAATFGNSATVALTSAAATIGQPSITLLP